MNARCALLLAAALIPAAGAAKAVEFTGIYFQHHDWELACDNTGTCRAAGYQQDRHNETVSVLLTRYAGPKQPVTATLAIGSLGESGFLDRLPRTFEVSMSIDDRDHGTLRLHRDSLSADLNDGQLAALLAALKGNGRIEWTAGAMLWELSGRGATAVLLKMDEFQGRLGTTGALLRQGANGESRVPAAQPAPIVYAARVSDKPVQLPLLARKALLSALRAATPQAICEDLHGPVDEGDLTVTHLNTSLALVSTRCFLAPYNTSFGYWIINTRAPYEPKLITSEGSEYAAGVISGIFKGRGIGDCMSSNQWTWNGTRFILTGSSSTGMCKAIAPGGAWELPTLVTEVHQK